MRSSKIKCRSAIRVIAFFLIVLALVRLCDFLIARENTYTRVMMHEMYQAQDVDLVFAGASTSYRHFDPEIWDETLGMHTFNLGSSNQRPDSTYYLLKELFSVHQPKYCIFSLNACSMLDLEGYRNPTAYYILADYFRPGLNKLQYMLHAFGGMTIYSALMPFLRYKTTLSAQSVRENVGLKTGEEYRSYSYDIYGSETETYRGRGYVYNTRQKEAGHVGALDFYPFSLEGLDQDIVSYVPRICQLCRENDCELIMIVSPLPYANLAMQENYQWECDFCRKLAADNGVALFDYSLCRPGYLPLDDTDFYDYTHMSGKGATAFSTVASQLIADYIAGKEIDREALFYSSYQELLDASPYVFNAWLTQDESDFTAHCTYGAGVVPEYEFSWRDSPEGEWQVVQRYGPARTLGKERVPQQAVELRICVRPVGCEDSFQQWDSVPIA